MTKDYDMRNLSDEELCAILNVSEPAMAYNQIMQQLTPAKKRIVGAAVELYRRFTYQVDSNERIKSSEDVAVWAQRAIGGKDTEEFYVLYLNQSAKLIKDKVLFSGGLSNTTVDVRVVLKEALLCGATSMCVAHNHPSGNVNPSGDDDRLTTALFQAGKTMNIRLLDHVIVTPGENYYSYANEGRI